MIGQSITREGVHSLPQALPGLYMRYSIRTPRGTQPLRAMNLNEQRPQIIPRAGHNFRVRNVKPHV